MIFPGPKRVSVLGFAAVFVILSASSSCARDAKKEIAVDGIERSYYVHVPPSYDGATSVPLVLALHGGGGAGGNMDKLTGFNAVGDREGFIVAYPSGVGRHWSDGRAVNKKDVGGKEVDDVAFLTALVDRLAGDYNIDRKRVFVTGISNGAFMSFRLACDRPDVFAAAAGVAGAVTEDLAAGPAPRAPVPVMFINGDEDPLVRYGGGEIKVGKKSRGTTLSVPASVAWWVKANGAATTPATTALPDADAADGTTAVREDYAGAGGADVVLITVRGGGHTWPGGWQYLWARVIGRTSRDFSASDVIWEFFKEHPRP